MRIAFVNGKGGVGKTTLSLLIAATLKENGHLVAVEDRDPQGSATSLAGNLEVPLGTNTPIVIVDTKPDVSHEPTLAAIREADLVILVTSPSPADLSTTVHTAEIIRQLRGEKPTRTLVNKLHGNTRLGKGLSAIEDQLPFPRLGLPLPYRQAYQLATLNGYQELAAEDQNNLLQITLALLAVK